MTSKPDRPSSFQTLKIKTTWGPIHLKLDGDHVVECSLPFLKNTPRKAFEIDGFQTLEAFIKNFPTIGKPAGTEFQQAVWKQLKNIPRGQTRTYGEIAKAIGRPKAMRAVGSACGANPLALFIPCHRAMAANGGFGGFSAGLPWKQMLLETEGAL